MNTDIPGTSAFPCSCLGRHYHASSRPATCMSDNEKSSTKEHMSMMLEDTGLLMDSDSLVPSGKQNTVFDFNTNISLTNILHEFVLI